MFYLEEEAVERLPSDLVLDICFTLSGTFRDLKALLAFCEVSLRYSLQPKAFTYVVGQRFQNVCVASGSTFRRIPFQFVFLLGSCQVAYLQLWRWRGGSLVMLEPTTSDKNWTKYESRFRNCGPWLHICTISPAFSVESFPLVFSLHIYFLQFWRCLKGATRIRSVNSYFIVEVGFLYGLPCWWSLLRNRGAHKLVYKLLRVA